MKVICRDTGKGKTKKLIELASKEDGYIVCLNHKEAYRISQQAIKMKKEIPFPLTFDEFLNGRFCAGNIKSFYIDDVDMLLNIISKNVPVNAITYTK
jgi:hypothetical protein